MWVRVPPPVGWTPYFYRACVPQSTTEDQNGILTDTERPPQRLNAAGLTLAPDWRAKVLKTTRAGIFFSAPHGNLASYHYPPPLGGLHQILGLQCLKGSRQPCKFALGPSSLSKTSAFAAVVEEFGKGSSEGTPFSDSSRLISTDLTVLIPECGTG